MTTRRSARSATSERYVVEQTLGSGGMATVYLAVDQALDRQVALKVLAAHLATDESFRDRFLREARLAARLVHPNIVRVYDVGEDDRGPFIVMEYVPGHTLADELRERGRLPPREVVAIGVQLCAGLEAAHAERLVHRDIKPQNILLRPDGHAKIADFGIVRSLGAATQHTEVGTVLGTAAYLAPEQARGEDVSESADLYSLGVVLYELLTGQTPHRADTPVELMLKHERAAITPPRELAPDVPPALDAIVMSCLAFRPKDRPASAAELGRDLAAALETVAFETLVAGPTSLKTAVLPENAPTTVRRSSRLAGRRLSRGWLIALAAGLAALALLAAALALSGSQSPPPKAAAHTKAPAKTTAKRVTTSTAAVSLTKPAQPSSASEALAAVRTAFSQAQTAGQIDPGVTADLSQRLDQISQALGVGNETDAGHRLTDLVALIGALAQRGLLSGAGLSRISTPLDRLAAFIAASPPTSTPAPAPAPAHPGPPAGFPHGHGHGRGHDHKGKD